MQFNKWFCLSSCGYQIYEYRYTCIIMQTLTHLYNVAMWDTNKRKFINRIISLTAALDSVLAKLISLTSVMKASAVSQL